MLDENRKDVISEQIADLIGDAGNTVCSNTVLSNILVGNYLDRVLKLKLLKFSWENIFEKILERTYLLIFCIRGPYSFGDATIRLSSLVLNHQVALIILREQLYRCTMSL